MIVSDYWGLATSLFTLLGFGGVSVAGLMAAAYALFRWLGVKWIEKKFADQMEANRAEQVRELERLRHKINGVFDRVVRLHTKEFEVLPDLWGKLVEAHAFAANYLSPLQQYPDIRNFDADQLDDYLDSTELTALDKREIKAKARSDERQDLLQQIITNKRHLDAMERITVFAQELRKSGIFVQPQIKKDMDRLLDLVHAAVLEKKLADELQIRPRPQDEMKRLREEGKSLLDKIEKDVGARLWDSTTAEV